MNDDETDALLAVVRQPEPLRTTVEERVQAIEDREAIRGLIMVYGYLCDARRWDELLELYCDDIERVLAGSLTERVRGKAALRAKLIAPTLERRAGDERASSPSELETLGLRHLMASDVIRLGDDGTSATAAVQYQMVATRDDGGLADRRRTSRSLRRRPGKAEDDRGFRRGAHEGSYVFEFRKDDGQWRFSRQFIVSDNAHNPMFRREAP